MRKSLVFALVGTLIAITSCGGREQAAEPRTKNAALAQPVLVNPNFSLGVGGWVGVGFKLGKGCQDSRVKEGHLPSLSWQANVLSFGASAQKVQQTVLIPQPSSVRFTIDMAIGRGAEMSTELRDDSETTSVTASGKMTLSVVTTRPNEAVIITLAGKGGPATCSGPTFRNALLSASPTPPPTTTTSTTSTTTTPPSTTTSSTTTSTTSTTTSTTSTVAPTTTAPPAAAVTVPAPQGPRCADAVPCVVGSIGPGTGIVYWVDRNQPKSWNRFFELAPPTWNQPQGDPVATVNDGLGLVRRGIKTTDGRTIPALATGTYKEAIWDVPSIEQLRQVYESKADPSMKGDYLSRTWADKDMTSFYFLNFDTGVERVAALTETAKVRPIRRGPASCALGGQCKIGDLGPRGGRVFYVTTPAKRIKTGSRDCNEPTNPCLYMEVAPSGWSGTPADPLRFWANPTGCCASVSNDGAKGQGIGAGAGNTSAIVYQQGQYPSAAKLAMLYDNYIGWYLPSVDEMKAVYSQRALVGGPTTGLYWTSTEISNTVAATFDFDTGRSNSLSFKDGFNRQHNGRLVRPVRAFAPVLPDS